MADWTAEQLEAAADKADAIRDELAGLQAMVDDIGTLDWPGMVTTADVKLLNLARDLRRNAESIRKRAACPPPPASPEHIRAGYRTSLDTSGPGR